jgi:SAM-dependent methyltransferase
MSVPNTLQDQVELLVGHPRAAAICGPLQGWYSWSGQAADVGRDRVQDRPFRDRIMDPPELLLRFLEDSSKTPSALLVRREVFSRVGGFEDSFRGLYEDQVFCAKLCLDSSVYVAGTCWYRYRQHPDSACSRATPQESAAARARFLEWLDTYVKGTAHSAAVTAAVRSEYVALRRRKTAAAPAVDFQQIARRMARALPSPAKRWLQWSLGRPQVPAVGRVRLGDLRRTRPLSRVWESDRGRPVDRHYIDGFLSVHAFDVRGVVLEIGDRSYTRRFGGDRVGRSEVLSLAPAKEGTIVGDLAAGTGIPTEAFDCIILTQTLHLIYDVQRATRTLYRILKPGGVVLATIPGISQVSRPDMLRSGDHWRFTSASAYRLFAEIFPRRYLTVQSHGNVLAAMAILQGLAAEELSPRELDVHDPDYEVILTVRAVKPRPSSGSMLRAASGS